MKISTILTIFLVLEVVDAVIAGIVIARVGVSFERNLLMRNFIRAYGFLSTSIIKIGLSVAFVFIVYYFHKKFKKFKNFLFYFSVILLLIALYGASSSIYALVYLL